MVENGVRIFLNWSPQAFLVEANQFQELLGHEFVMAGRQRTPPVVLPIYLLTNTLPKQTRIRTLGTLLAQRPLRFRGDSNGARLLLQQLRDFPCGDFNDGPDALAMAVRMAAFLIGEREPGPPTVLKVV